LRELSLDASSRSGRCLLRGPPSRLDFGGLPSYDQERFGPFSPQHPADASPPVQARGVARPDRRQHRILVIRAARTNDAALINTALRRDRRPSRLSPVRAPCAAPCTRTSWPPAAVPAHRSP